MTPQGSNRIQDRPPRRLWFLASIVWALLAYALISTIQTVLQKAEDGAHAPLGLHSDFFGYVRYGLPVLFAAALVGVVGAAVFAWSGLYDVAASAGHWPPTRALLHYTMKQSVALHASNRNPPQLENPDLILRGAAHYHTGCAPCHGAPGDPASPIEIGATPPPPPLYDIARQFTPDEIHWIVKHGIKMTAMPAWPAQDRGDEVWALVAFLEKFPTLSRGEYERLAFGPLQQLKKAELKPGLPALSEAPPEVKATCARCHGIDGHDREHAFPNIAGLDRLYVARQLRAFAAGARPARKNQSSANILL